ncbi:hypothetical protein JD969_19230 [Planctomycetota bacterium]|nr:hypothetical protein JD969_19230 [Planctomycetota bacterium]
MVNRSDRNKVIAVIEQFVNEEIKEDEFIFRLGNIYDDTDDDSLKLLLTEKSPIKWGSMYCGDRDTWNTLERLRLFLSSDACVGINHTVRYSWLRIISIMLLLTWGSMIFIYEWDVVFTIGSLLLGLPAIGMGYCWWRKLQMLKRDYAKDASVLQPFNSYEQIREVYTKVGDFKKRQMKRMENNRTLFDCVFYGVFRVLIFLLVMLLLMSMFAGGALVVLLICLLPISVSWLSVDSEQVSV